MGVLEAAEAFLTEVWKVEGQSLSRALDAAAQRAEAPLAAAYRLAVRQLKEGIGPAQVEALRTMPGALEEALPFGEHDATLRAGLIVTLTEAFLTAVGKTTETYAGPEGEELPAQALVQEVALAWAERRADEASAEISAGTRAALREALATSLAEGRSAAETTLALQRAAGLTEVQAAALETRRAALVAAGKTVPEIRDDLRQYAADLLLQRQAGIAETETWAATQRGHVDAADLLDGLGHLDEGLVMVWRIKDLSACGRCRELDGEEAPIGGTFPDAGPFGLPPAHPHCRCRVELRKARPIRKWDESQHPREGSGEDGGQFTAGKGGAGSKGKDKDDKEDADPDQERINAAGGIGPTPEENSFQDRTAPDDESPQMLGAANGGPDSDAVAHGGTDIHDSNALPITIDRTEHAGTVRPDDDADQAKLMTAGVTDYEPNGTGVSASYKVTLTNGGAAMWKPESGNYDTGLPSPDFVNEAASYDLAKAMGYTDMVPASVARFYHGPDGPEKGSFQRWGDAAWQKENPVKKNLGPPLERAMAFDYLISNVDRHSKNFLVRADGSGAPVLIDSGMSMPGPAGDLHGEGLRSYWGVHDKVPSPAVLKPLKAVQAAWPKVAKQMARNGLKPASIKGVKKRLDMLLANTGKTWQQIAEAY